MKRIDFHMHTTHSDGSLSPRELIRQCHQKKLACISVTDHDTMSSYKICKEEGEKWGLEVVPGVEISVQFEPGTLHILGYFQDPAHPALKKVFQEIQAARRERNPRIIEKLNALGVPITLEEVIAEAGGEDSPDQKQIGRPHFARVLIKKGYARNFEEAFQKYLTKGKPAYVDKRRVASKEAIQLIREAGGIASVAHPKQMRLSPEALEKEMEKLAEEGLEAIEVYNSCQTPEDNRLFKKVAQRFNLVETGGSDFHGANKPEVELGFLGRDVRLGYEMVEELRDRIRKRGS
jgi:hypothetical protein